MKETFTKLKQMKTESWLLLLLAGVLLLVIALPTKKSEAPSVPVTEEAGKDTAQEYAGKLEKRVEELLSGMEGVGRAEVMITVESGGEAVLQTDASLEQKTTKETDSAGGYGLTEEKSQSSQTVLTGSGDSPYVTKELCPRVTGIVIAADGGGDAAVKAEISEAMEALFGLPAHKIKVLKRVKEES